MNKQQKQVLQASLSNDKEVLKALKKMYAQSEKECAEKIAQLSARTDLENLQTIIYQQRYQRVIQKQIADILKALQDDEYDTLNEYLHKCYENGYIGAMYDIMNQGVPVIQPIDQYQVSRAITLDSKLSTNLYNRLGEDVDKLKSEIPQLLSRGIIQGKSWSEVAKSLRNSMVSPFSTALNNSLRIARTEGHRVQQEAQLHALEIASNNGADIVKQWDATLDSRTRPDHQQADGQIVGLDEYFIVGGEKLKAPGIGGSAKQVVNCRCCMLQRATWALDASELKELQERASYYGLDKTKQFSKFKEKYLNI